jgi:hypothetical protein
MALLVPQLPTVRTKESFEWSKVPYTKDGVKPSLFTPQR